MLKAMYMAFVAKMDKKHSQEETSSSSLEGKKLPYFLQELPDDVFSLVSAAISCRDLCNLSATCKKLHSLCCSDKLWMPQCENLVMECTTINLEVWRNFMSSYKALFRFLYSVKPLIGIWVHQNPELGNLVYVTWGFLSVVGCRIIPQELGPRGLETGLLWAPVFEVISNLDGSLNFFLHGREREDYCYPGWFSPAKQNCNVLSLEAEPFFARRITPDSPDSPLVGLTAENSEDSAGEECTCKFTQEGRRFVKVEAILTDRPQVENNLIQFQDLSFGDRRRILELLAPAIRLKVPTSAAGPLIPKCSLSCFGNEVLRDTIEGDPMSAAERRALLLWMHGHGVPYAMEPESGSHCDGVESSVLLKTLCVSETRENEPRSAAAARLEATNHERIEFRWMQNGKMATNSQKRHGFGSFLRSKLKRIIGKGTQQESKRSCLQGAAENKKLHLQEFLKQGTAIRLRLQATSSKLSLYRSWPIINENRFALYKMPEQKPVEGRELAGLWGGTFGWPPGKPAEDKPGKPLFFFLLSYDVNELIATKILEGTHYVLHPNGSAMFTAKINEPSSESFPSIFQGNVDIVHSYQGEGIANGYGFRYPSTKPGDLFVDSSGLLAFVWRETKAVLTLQRLDLQALLLKGERVAPLAPIANFAYLTKANSNIFAGYHGAASFTSLVGRNRPSEARS